MYVKLLCTQDHRVSNDSPPFHQIQEEYPFIGRYRNAWPVSMLIRQFMNNRRGYRQANLNTDADVDDDENVNPNPDADADEQTAGPSTTTMTAEPGDNENHNSSEDENLSDVSVSDIDN